MALPPRRIGAVPRDDYRDDAAPLAVADAELQIESELAPDLPLGHRRARKLTAHTAACRA